MGVLLLGLSLEPEDIRFFEDEECDDTRIRTIEASEVEQQMILWRRVVSRHTDYNFAMHSVRALITNFFPADYDYEAPVQTLRHRLYITLHALDRRITGLRDRQYGSIMNGLPSSASSSAATLGCLAFLAPVICGVKGLIVTPVAGTYFCILQQRKNVALQGSNMLKPT